MVSLLHEEVAMDDAANRSGYDDQQCTDWIQIALRQFGSSIFFTSMEMEPSAFPGCSHAQATGFNTPA
jgi:hypothetical protein